MESGIIWMPALVELSSLVIDSEKKLETAKELILLYLTLIKEWLFLYRLLSFYASIVIWWMTVILLQPIICSIKKGPIMMDVLTLEINHCSAEESSMS